MVLLDDEEEIKKFQEDLRIKREIPKWYFDKVSALCVYVCLSVSLSVRKI